MTRPVLAVLLISAAACSASKGEPTTPEKAANYTANNIKGGVEDAPGIARRSGKRITKAVNDPEKAVMGDSDGAGQKANPPAENAAATDGAEQASATDGTEAPPASGDQPTDEK